MAAEITAPKTIDPNTVVEEYNKLEQNLTTLQDELRDMNDRVQRLKQNVLIASGAKVALGKLLGLNP